MKYLNDPIFKIMLANVNFFSLEILILVEILYKKISVIFYDFKYFFVVKLCDNFFFLTIYNIFCIKHDLCVKYQYFYIK